MIHQRLDSDCGVASMRNAIFVATGREIGYWRLAGMYDDLSEGLDECDVMRTLVHRLGHSLDEIDTSDRRDAGSWLRRWAPVAPLILCVDDWGHWVVVAGQCGPRFCLLDPGRDPYNLRVNGQRWARPKKILRRWRAAKRFQEDGGLYYGLALLVRTT